jgi:hypothetical protein
MPQLDIFTFSSQIFWFYLGFYSLLFFFNLGIFPFLSNMVKFRYYLVNVK